MALALPNAQVQREDGGPEGPLPLRRIAQGLPRRCCQFLIKPQNRSRHIQVGLAHFFVIRPLDLGCEFQNRLVPPPTNEKRLNAGHVRHERPSTTGRFQALERDFQNKQTTYKGQLIPLPMMGKSNTRRIEE